MSPPTPDARTPEREIRVGRVPPQCRLGHEVAPSSGGKGEAADRGPRPSRKHRGPPRVLAELHSVSCPHWLRSDGTRGKERTQKLRVAQRPRWPRTRLSFPNGGPAPRMHAAEEAHSAAFKIRRRAAVTQHGDCACHSRPATHGVAPANGLETQCETSDLHLPIWGALWPQKQNQKGSRRTARPTHSPPHTRVSVCTNATFCFVRSIDKSNFGV